MWLLWSVYFAAILKRVFFFTLGKYYSSLYFAFPIYICIVNQKTLNTCFAAKKKNGIPHIHLFFFQRSSLLHKQLRYANVYVKLSILSLASLKSSKTRHTLREGSYENKYCPQMVLINHLTPTLTHVWLFGLTPFADRAYPSAGVIFGPLVLEHDERVSD